MPDKKLFDRVVEETIDKDRPYGIHFTESARIYLKEMKAKWDATYSQTIAISKILLGDATKAEVLSLIDPDSEDTKEIVADFFVRKIEEYGIKGRMLDKLFDRGD